MSRKRALTSRLNCSTPVLLLALVACGSDDRTGPAPVPDASVAAVRITPATSTIALGATVQLQAATLDDTGAPLTDREITWSSQR